MRFNGTIRNVHLNETSGFLVKYESFSNFLPEPLKQICFVFSESFLFDLFDISLIFRQNAFEVVGMDGTSSGVIHCDDTQSLHDWIQCIAHNIMLLNNQSVSIDHYLLHSCLANGT